MSKLWPLPIGILLGIAWLVNAEDIQAMKDLPPELFTFVAPATCVIGIPLVVILFAIPAAAFNLMRKRNGELIGYNVEKEITWKSIY